MLRYYVSVNVENKDGGLGTLVGQKSTDNVLEAEAALRTFSEAGGKIEKLETSVEAIKKEYGI